jgi:hypothetical protein
MRCTITPDRDAGTRAQSALQPCSVTSKRMSVIITADVRHHEQVAPTTKGSRKVR